MAGVGDGQVQFSFIGAGCDPDSAVCFGIVFCRVVDEVNEEAKNFL